MTHTQAIFAAVELPAWLFNSIFSMNRWLHLVATTLLVGGVLFFVFVVPIATSDLRIEHQIAVFGKARWMFRKIVKWSILVLVFTGGLSLWRMWAIYNFDRSDVHGFCFSATSWAVAHVICGVLGAAILIRVTATRRIHGHPVGWLRAALALLLIAMLLASVTRQLLLNIDDRRNPQSAPFSAR